MAIDWNNREEVLAQSSTKPSWANPSSLAAPPRGRYLRFVICVHTAASLFQQEKCAKTRLNAPTTVGALNHRGNAG